MAKNKFNHLGSLFNRESLYDHDASQTQDDDYHFEGDYNSILGMSDDDFKVKKIHHRKYKKQNKNSSSKDKGIC